MMWMKNMFPIWRNNKGRSRPQILILLILMIVLVSILFTVAQVSFLANQRRIIEDAAETTKRSAINQLYFELNQVIYEVNVVSGLIAGSAVVQRYVRRDIDAAYMLPSVRLAVDIARIGSGMIESVIITDFMSPPLLAYGRRDMTVLADAERILFDVGRRIYSPTHFMYQMEDGFIPFNINFTNTPLEFPQVYVIIIYNINAIARMIEHVDAQYGTRLALFAENSQLLLSNYNLTMDDFPENLHQLTIYNIRTPDIEVRRLERINWKLVAYLNQDVLLSHMEPLQMQVWMISGILAITFLFFIVVINMRLKNQGKIYNIELEQKRAENAALMNQINPHFLYNTLNCMRGTVLSHAEKDTVKIIDAMAYIMRYGIKTEAFVKVSEEMQSIRRYMEIISIRHGGRISICEDIAPEVEDCIMPKMILQPIVENAVFYGLEPVSREGSITIRSKTDGSFLLFTVEDNGKGMSEEEMHTVQSVLKSSDLPDPENTGNHIGIRNIHRRLRLLYDEHCGVEIYSKENEGTKVLIRLYNKSHKSHIMDGGV